MNVDLDSLAPALRSDTPARQPKSSDLMSVLAELETIFPVGTWQVGGLHIWPLLRQRWYFREWAAHYAQSGASGAGNASRGYVAQAAAGALAAVRANRRDPAGRDLTDAKRDLVFLSDGVSFARLGGKWVERFCDPLIALAGQRGLSSALWTPLHAYHLPRFTPSRFVQSRVDGANVLGALRSRIWAPDAVLPGAVAMAKWLAGRGFGSSALAPPKVVSDACRVRALADEFKRMLQRARPRLAFLVSFYGVEGMSFVLACRECGVPVVDIQHGVQGELHPAYAAWETPPDRDRHALLPDRFWVWSDWERSVIERWSAGTGHAAVVGGNPWMELWRKGSAWTGVADAFAQAQSLRERARGRPVVLVTLQFGLSPAEQLEPLADLLRAAEDRLCFWVRLHPAMLERRAEIRALLGKDATVELDECSDLPLQALLPHCDLHLTHSSSTVIEASLFGVPSVLTTEYGGELFAPLVAAGRARVFTGDAARLARALVESAGGRAPQSAPEPPAEAALEQLLAASPAATTGKLA